MRTAVLPLALIAALPAAAGTVALWLFDEPAGSYPSTILNESTGGHIVALGRAGRIVEGKFGRALEVGEPAPIAIRYRGVEQEGVGPVLFGLAKPPIPAGRKMQPLWWGNATFSALGTVGERHLRAPRFRNPSESALNLGDSDWTVEFWFFPLEGAGAEQTVLEIGRGPRAENEEFTRLAIDSRRGALLVYRGDGKPIAVMKGEPGRLEPGARQWVHVAVTYSAARKQFRHFLNGVPQQPVFAAMPERLPAGEEAYLTIGCDGRFERRLRGRLDELRVSDELLYDAAFTPPGSYSLTYSGKLPRVNLPVTLPLLFPDGRPAAEVVDLGSRKHLFLDDALIARSEGITFVPNPPERREMVFKNLRGHLSMVEDEKGRLRIYYRAKDDSLAVVTSSDGVRWEYPDLGWEHQGQRNIVLAAQVGLGNVFLDPFAPPAQRWKYFSGIRRHSMFVFSSPDGWRFTPHETAALPFAAGSQSVVYYDDQRGLWVGHHRSDYGSTQWGRTERRFLISETKNLLEPWAWTPATPERTAEAARRMRIKSNQLDPWFLDNGPLSPGGLGIELPVIMGPVEGMDPPATDIYTTKVVKYPWAPDAYLAFPSVYFHYEGAEPKTRSTLGEERRKLGSGVVEVQLAVSRDGLRWKRYPRPAYVPINSGGADAIHMMFMTHGLARRGNEIWQYAGGHAGNGVNYHSAWVRQEDSPLWRFVQRMDGFVAAEAPYTGGEFTTHPLRFRGRKLVLNIDTGATGYAQIGFLDGAGRPIAGFSVEDCVYINGDFLQRPVEFLERGTDVSALAGKTVRLVFRMRGARLYAMQFVE